MRVNVYAEEMTDRIEIISKVIDGQEFTGLRIYLELPTTHVQDGINLRPATAHDTPNDTVLIQHRAPFIHRHGDDDSSAVTFWGKRDLRLVLQKAVDALGNHYAERNIQRFNSTYDANARARGQYDK